jgi:hypothetical protein
MVRGQTKQVVPEAPSPKYSKAKWTGGVAQAVKGLLCKCEALSLNPSPTKKKKKKKLQRSEGSRLEASPGKKLARPLLYQ